MNIVCVCVNDYTWKQVSNALGQELTNWLTLYSWKTVVNERNYALWSGHVSSGSSELKITVRDDTSCRISTQ